MKSCDYRRCHSDSGWINLWQLQNRTNLNLKIQGTNVLQGGIYAVWHTVAPPTETEIGRVTPALCRFETSVTLFRRKRFARDSADIQRTEDHYFDTYPPWAWEETASIRDYFLRNLFKALMPASKSSKSPLELLKYLDTLAGVWID